MMTVPPSATSHLPPGVSMTTGTMSAYERHMADIETKAKALGGKVRFLVHPHHDLRHLCSLLTLLCLPCTYCVLVNYGGPGAGKRLDVTKSEL